MGNSLFVSIYKVLDRKLIEIPELFDFLNEKQQHEEIFNKAYEVAKKESFHQPIIIESCTDYGDSTEFSVWVNGQSVFFNRNHDCDDEICLHKNLVLIEELNKLQIPACTCKQCSHIIFNYPT